MALEITMGKDLKVYWGTSPNPTTLVECVQRIRLRTDVQPKTISCFGQNVERVIDTMARIEFEVESIGVTPWTAGEKIYLEVKKVVGQNETTLFTLPKCLVVNVEHTVSTSDELRSTSTLQPTGD
ncbi:MAG: hypothetical protein ABIK73_07075 [candidate division WOR-3 bacterium]